MVAMDLGMVLRIDMHYICPAGKGGSSTAGAKASSTPCLFYVSQVCLHVIWFYLSKHIFDCCLYAQAGASYVGQGRQKRKFEQSPIAYQPLPYTTPISPTTIT